MNQPKILSLRNSTKAITIIGVGLLALFCSTTVYAPPVNKVGDGAVPSTMKEFTTPGVATFVVPTGVFRLLVQVWGAGGGGGDGFVSLGPFGHLICLWYGGFGAAGAYSRAAINVAAGDTVTITVGQGGGPGGLGSSSSVADGSYVITSGGGGGGSNAGDCFAGANGGPGTPDPKAAIGRASASHEDFQRPASAIPASGSIEPLGGGYGGLAGTGTRPGTGGTNGYVFIEW